MTFRAASARRAKSPGRCAGLAPLSKTPACQKPFASFGMSRLYLREHGAGLSFIPDGPVRLVRHVEVVHPAVGVAARARAGEVDAPLGARRPAQAVERLDVVELGDVVLQVAVARLVGEARR